MLPSRRPEEAVYVRDKWDGSYVVASRLESSLWGMRQMATLGRVDGGSLDVQHPAVEVAKAPIEKPLTALLTQLWRAALLSTRHPAKQPIRLDGESFHFGTNLMSGQTWSPTPGSRLAGLVDVGLKLASYARVLPEQRASLAELLHSDIGALFESFPQDSASAPHQKGRPMPVDPSAQITQMLEANMAAPGAQEALGHGAGRVQWKSAPSGAPTERILQVYELRESLPAGKGGPLLGRAGNWAEFLPALRSTALERVLFHYADLPTGHHALAFTDEAQSSLVGVLVLEPRTLQE